MTKTLKSPSPESVRQRLKNLSRSRGRPFDELLRYYAMERFLYRLSISRYAQKFFLKGGLLLKVWNACEHRATMDIDLLARASNRVENLRSIFEEISAIDGVEDAISFDTSAMAFRSAQTTGVYEGVRCRFSAQLFTSRIPILIDIGFNDRIVPSPRKITYPAMLEMPNPILLGYPIETAFAEKLESIVKLAMVNTRMKDFYDLWTFVRHYPIDRPTLSSAVREVFSHRGTPLDYPLAFTPAFYARAETEQQWKNFLLLIGSASISLGDVIAELSAFLQGILDE